MGVSPSVDAGDTASLTITLGKPCPRGLCIVGILSTIGTDTRLWPSPWLPGEPADRLAQVPVAVPHPDSITVGHDAGAGCGARRCGASRIGLSAVKEVRPFR